MHTLVILEHDSDSVRPGSLSALGFAQSVAQQSGKRFTSLVLGHQIEAVGKHAATYGPVILADHESLAHSLADRYAPLIADTVKRLGAELIVAASSTWSKDIVGRAAGLLGGIMASDVTSHDFVNDELQLKRPMFAGAIDVTLALEGVPKIVTVRASSYAAPPPTDKHHAVDLLPVDPGALSYGTQFESLDANSGSRPDVTEAKIVASGGRAFKNPEDFERLVGGLADCLNAATGSSRALVDAGITPNSLQVGQTGKIVAPDCYLALGISGAIQHLAGMKNSKIVVAINNDPDAPIFDVADYGLVGDVYEVIPELIEKLSNV